MTIDYAKAYAKELQAHASSRRLIRQILESHRVNGSITDILSHDAGRRNTDLGGSL